MKLSRLMLSKVLATLIISLLVLSGCATPYQDKGFTGGFEETRLDVDVYQIRFSGNGLTGEQRAFDFAFLRAAELTLEAGYSYFVVLDGKDWVDASTGSGKANTHCYDWFGQTKCSTRYNNNRTEKPRSSRMIQMFKSKPAKGNAYSAGYLYESLTEKYEIEKDENLLKQAAVPTTSKSKTDAVVSPEKSKGKYSGQSKDGKRHGIGTQEYPDGGKYYGNWADNLRHGEGAYFESDGRVLEGTWVNGKLDGYVTQTFPDGEVYEGFARAGKHQYGVLTCLDGTTIDFYWENGKQISGHECPSSTKKNH